MPYLFLDYFFSNFACSAGSLLPFPTVVNDLLNGPATLKVRHQPCRKIKILYESAYKNLIIKTDLRASTKAKIVQKLKPYFKVKYFCLHDKNQFFSILYTDLAPTCIQQIFSFILSFSLYLFEISPH